MTITERLQQATDVRVAFCTSTGILSRLIRWFESGKVSHVELTFALPDLICREVLSADSGGVTIRPIESAEGIFKEYTPPPGVDLKAGMLEAAKQLGSAYDFAGLFGMAPVELLRRLGRRIANPLQDRRAWFCSEICCVAMRRAGWPGVETMDPGSTDPQQLMTICEAKHGP